MPRLRNTVEQFILKEPQWFVLVSLRRPVPCSRCYSEVYKGSSGDWCNECLGTGYKVELFKVPGRRTSLRMVKEERDIISAGYVSEAHALIYFPEWVRPKDGDIVVEVIEWHGVYPRSVFRAHRIMIALTMSQSELSFYECGCNPIDFDLDKLVKAIRSKRITLIR